VLGNDTDLDGDALTAVLVGGPGHGALTLNADGSFHLTRRRTDFNGSDSSLQAATGRRDSNVATVTLTITP